MSDYPNMSYCMFENTAGALEQVTQAMEDASSVDDLDMSKYEENAYHKLARLARDYLDLYERLEEQAQYEEEEELDLI